MIWSDERCGTLERVPISAMPRAANEFDPELRRADGGFAVAAEHQQSK